MSHYYSISYPTADWESVFGDALAALNTLSPQRDGDTGPSRVSRRIGHGHAHGGLHTPRLDVRESAETNEVTATLELPGVRKEDVKIDFQDRRLTVYGETVRAPGDDSGYTVKERHFGKFSRTLQLPLGVKAQNVKADLSDGVLTITFPKSTQEQEAQHIAVN